MDFKFQKFERTNSRYLDRITVTKTNSFGFPTRFYKNNNIDQYKYAVLYYDPEQKGVGISFTSSEEEKHRFTIIKSKKGFGGSIIATSFFKTYNIDANKYQGRYQWEIKEYPETGKLFVIVLKEKAEKEAEPEKLSIADGGVPKGS